MRNKLELTRGILEQLPAGHGYTAEDMIKQWWINLRDDGGLRLTSVGYMVLETLDLESWSIDLSDRKPMMSKRLLLELDRKLQWPYYIDSKKKKLVMYSSREAMLATLYGDLESFLKQYS